MYPLLVYTADEEAAHEVAPDEEENEDDRQAHEDSQGRDVALGHVDAKHARDGHGQSDVLAAFDKEPADSIEFLLSRARYSGMA